jgi:hypothetical protein
MKADLAYRMGVFRAALSRLLNETSPSLIVKTLAGATGSL